MSKYLWDANYRQFIELKEALISYFHSENMQRIFLMFSLYLQCPWTSSVQACKSNLDCSLSHTSCLRTSDEKCICERETGHRIPCVNMSASELKETASTTTNKKTKTKAEQSSKKKSDMDVAKITAAWYVVILLLLCCATLYIFIFRRQRRIIRTQRPRASTSASSGGSSQARQASSRLTYPTLPNRVCDLKHSTPPPPYPPPTYSPPTFIRDPKPPPPVYSYYN